MEDGETHQVFQCCVSVLSAVLRSCSWPKVHSSTMLAFPVLSNKLGVIHGCSRSDTVSVYVIFWGAIRSTHLQHEPATKVDTTNCFSTAYMSVGSRGRDRENTHPSVTRRQSRD